MCFIMLVKQLPGRPTEEAKEAIRTVLAEKIGSNRDGFYFNNKGVESPVHFRTLNRASAEVAAKTVPLNNLMVHFRIATMGKVAEDNVHGFTHDGYRFVHNGSVHMGYRPDNGYYLNAVHSDSNLFFQELCKLLDGTNRKPSKVAESINAMLEGYQFYGRAALYDEVKDRMYLFGDFECYVYGGFMVLASAKITLNRKPLSQKSKVCGLQFYQAEEHPKSVLEGNVGVIERWSTDQAHYRGILAQSKYKVGSVSTHYWDKDKKEEPAKPLSKKQQKRLRKQEEEEARKRKKAEKHAGPIETAQKKFYENWCKTPGIRSVTLPAPRVETPATVTDIVPFRKPDPTVHEANINPVYRTWDAHDEFVSKNTSIVKLNADGLNLVLSADGLHDELGACCYNNTCKDNWRSLTIIEEQYWRAEYVTMRQELNSFLEAREQMELDLPPALYGM